MSENEKTIRLILGTLPSDMTARSRERSVGSAFKALDALLAEHRAEVGKLTQERDEWKGRAESRQEEIERTMAERQREWQGKQNEAASYERTVAALRTEVEHLKRDKESLRLCYEAAKARESSAHDTALEEVATELARAKASEARERWTGGLGRGERLLAEEQRLIRALKSQPARQYVDVEKVRTVARQILGTRKLVSNPVGAVHDMLEILGVDLDAEGDESATPITPELVDAASTAAGLPPLDSPDTMTTSCPGCGHAPHWALATKDTAPHSYCCERSSWSAPNCGCGYMPEAITVSP